MGKLSRMRWTSTVALVAELDSSYFTNDRPSGRTTGRSAAASSSGSPRKRSREVPISGEMGLPPSWT
eukprot:181414-Alexandrium_andersonii.AAC.1